MSTVTAAMLADLLVGELEKHVADPSPVRDASATDMVDVLYRNGFGAQFAEHYVANQLTRALTRLRTGLAPGEPAWKTGNVVHDALLALGAYAHLQDRKSGVSA
ncbi:hypothetical protein Drose_06550 [Dactylosporangium roseum]|uniref:Uncharacterized protein n=1 Tax=Dactylosporangium roseum TaxID=47989 RepID=A0ABY5ZAU7_9ACTN|nr:hypothetical protein [Dactylosporangium roseum]UWZ37932.1 hypothetical protein Drose_06550 [Dactylosporangium roseum]